MHGAGKGDSPRPVKGETYRENFAEINWHKPKALTPWEQEMREAGKRLEAEYKRHWEDCCRAEYMHLGEDDRPFYP